MSLASSWGILETAWTENSTGIFLQWLSTGDDFALTHHAGCREMFLVSTTGRCCWHVVGGGQGCPTAPTAKNDGIPNVDSATGEKSPSLT